jgi:hypothetical protein
MTSRVKIPQEAKDAENLTGEQSAIRKAQEVLKDAIKDIHSWEHLHGFVRTKGMAYEKKGSGAVIRVGEIVVKASSVSRNLSLNRLEKQFGESWSLMDYDQASPSDSKSISEPKPLDKSNDNANWRAYIAERNDYYRDKKRVREELSMTQREEKEAMRNRQSVERASMFKSFKEHPCSRIEIKRQRSILASKHAYERAVLKESQKASRDELKNQRPAYCSYEQWLRDRGLINEADNWRHRKDSQFIQFESPNLGRHESVTTEPKGLPGFNMAVTKQGLRFYRESAPKEASFIDMGRVIRVYKHDDETILAALQLAQEKWGGVKINGSDEYKRRSAEIATRHGIKVVNPELQTIENKQPESSLEPARMAPDEARKYRESCISKTAAPRIERYEREMAEKLKFLRETEKAAVLSFEEIKRRKPEEGLFDALPILRQKYEEKLKNWQRELREAERKIASVRRDVGNHPHDIEAGRERITCKTAKEFDSLNPSIAAVIHDDDIRREREGQERERRETEARKRFHASIRELAAGYGEKVSFTTNAQDGRNYSGLMLGVAERDGHYYAVHLNYGDHVILHNITKDDIPAIEAIKGKKVEISCENGEIGEIREESQRLERSRDWSR